MAQVIGLRVIGISMGTGLGQIGSKTALVLKEICPRGFEECTA